jgi:Mn-dependent DtxR family transcriptional regulator
METKKYEAAAMELTALGLIEFKDSTYFRLTEQGLAKGKKIIWSLPVTEQILVLMAAEEIAKDSPIEPDRS